MNVAIVAGALAASLTLPCAGATSTFDRERAPQGGVRMSEWQLRQYATVAPMPAYPRPSLAAKASGVVVAAVRFGVDGRAQSVDILEAPDPHIAEAVRDAIGRWTVPGVHVAGRETTSAVHGKLTFYFQFREGKGRVVDPDQMPGATPRPKPRAGLPPPSSGSPSSATSAPPAAPPVIHGGHGETLETITAAAFKKQAAGGHLVLDFGGREAFRRGHWPGAVNIPLDELAVRGGAELPREKLIVVDCTQEDVQLCRLAGGRLVEQRFPNVVLLVR